MPSHKNMEPSRPQLGAHSWSQAFLMICPLVLQIEVTQESAHCPWRPFCWAGATSLIHNSIGHGSGEARELRARPGQTRGWL